MDVKAPAQEGPMEEIHPYALRLLSIRASSAYKFEALSLERCLSGHLGLGSCEFVLGA